VIKSGVIRVGETARKIANAEEQKELEYQTQEQVQ